MQKESVYEQLGLEVGQLVDEKQAAYGGIDRVYDAMMVFYPDGIPVEKMNDALLVVRILDKINRITGGNKDAFDESPYRDIAGYALLGMREESQRRFIIECIEEGQKQEEMKNCSTCALGPNEPDKPCHLSMPCLGCTEKTSAGSFRSIPNSLGLKNQK